MTGLAELEGKRCAVCFTYGDDDSLFLHCVGQGAVKDDEFYIERDDDPFFIRPGWNIEIRETPENIRQKVRDADHLVVVRVIASLGDLDRCKMDLLLRDGESIHHIEGRLRYDTSENLTFVYNKHAKPITIYRDWFPRIQKSQREELYFLWLSVGKLPPDADPDEYEEMGFTLPSGDE